VRWVGSSVPRDVPEGAEVWGGLRDATIWVARYSYNYGFAGSRRMRALHLTFVLSRAVHAHGPGQAASSATPDSLSEMAS